MTAGGGNGTPASRTYFGWQEEKVAFIFGVSGQRAAMLAAGVLSAAWPLAVSDITAGAVCWPVAGLLITLVFVRIAGRTVDEWIAAATSYALLRSRDQNKFASAAFAPRSKARPNAPARMDLPGILAPLTIMEAGFGSGAALAVVHNRYERTFTAVARIRFPGIGLVDSARRDLRVAGWGGLLSSLCTEGNPIVRVQALQRLVPESGAALRRWHADHLSGEAPPVAVQVTGTLLETSTLATSQREALLSFTMDHKRAASQIRAAGGGAAGGAVVLVRHLKALSSAISGADLQVEGWLDPRELAEVLRTAFDPHSARVLAEQRAGALAGVEDGELAGVDPALAGPAAAEARSGSYLHDGAQTVSYVVHDWPRHQVYSTALAPLLGEGDHRRAFSLHVEPLGPRKAEQEVMRERTARDVAIRMRQRTGQIVPEHERAALDRARAQDRERAAGHGLVRFSAYVAVTVTDPAKLDDACAALEADAAAARISIRRMWMAQDIGFALSALPLGMGLPRKRW
ncbi:lipoprotein [Sphaerisporangium melleum]|uniref:Lipoprotein n=1 Tax=Sphaerisporangium melleum TaxID=321316 RepID=A0A917R200_9ACTN|nr:SCO6880 family protein [Sphaerisporangium melleum]GGK82106.1 lipoprotein [Sphaerisporangium melleum]GII71372.1 lipoprotein [Sphaerisporangium melleum]